MRVFKIILKILIIIIFVMSVTLNILLFGSSYGTLVFKYNENKFLSMNSFASSQLDFTELNSKKNSGIQLTVTSLSGDNKLKINYYFDKNANPMFEYHHTYEDGENLITNSSYFVNNTLYEDNNGEKSQGSASFNDALLAHEIVKTCLLSNSAIQENSKKAKISFSIKPLYLVGIKYSYTDEVTGNSYKYEYDLKGYLRKVTTTTKDDEIKITLSYKNKKIEFPSDLSEY